MGVPYKRNIEDVRESPALDLLPLLEQRGAEVSYSDPHVPPLRLDGQTLEAEPEAIAAAADCVVIVTDYAAFDYAALVGEAKLIVDTRNAPTGFDSGKIVRL
jgi:UDP-N-acetyl-D-glucosamine dehydrogenase